MRGPGTTRRPGAAFGWLLAGLLGCVIGVVLLVHALHPSPPAPAPPLAADGAGPHQHASPSAAPKPTPLPSPAGKRGTADLVTGPVLPPSPPLRVTIPRLRVSSTLETLGVGADGQMDVPVDPARAGWYHLGPPPGALGPAVIAGHVSWNQVPGVFYGLERMRPGDVVRVDRQDGRTAVFEVTRVQRFEKSRFPTRSVFGAIDHAGLRLITCGGDYDATAHHFSANVVVFARLTGASS